MIAYLKGAVKYILADGCVIDVRGVGYRVSIDARTLGGLSVGDEVEFLIHTAFGNDAITLYGFNNQSDYELFGRLITVSGIGAKTALGMLSRMSAGELASAIANKDVAALTRLPGLGKKSAERLILELHDKVAAIGSSGDMSSSREKLDAAAALDALGYNRADVEKFLGTVNESLSTEELIKLALRELR